MIKLQEFNMARTTKYNFGLLSKLDRRNIAFDQGYQYRLIAKGYFEYIDFLKSANDVLYKWEVADAFDVHADNYYDLDKCLARYDKDYSIYFSDYDAFTQAKVHFQLVNEK